MSGGGSYQAGSPDLINASANSGYVFGSWTLNGTVVSSSPSYTFVASSNTTLVANFVSSGGGNAALVLASSPTGGGNVTGGGSYPAGTAVTITANANSGYVFGGWTWNGNLLSTSPSFSYTVNSNVTLVANFVPQYVSVGLFASPSAGGSVSGGGSYQAGTPIAINASAKIGRAHV